MIGENEPAAEETQPVGAILEFGESLHHSGLTNFPKMDLSSIDLESLIQKTAEDIGGGAKLSVEESLTARVQPFMNKMQREFKAHKNEVNDRTREISTKVLSR